MDKLKKVVMVAFLLLSVNADGDDETSKLPTTNIIDAATRLFSVPTVSNSWFIHPNLDFRAGGGGTCGGGDEEEKEEASAKVKDAVAKSLDKSRTTVLDSAKSAASALKHKLNPPQPQL